MKSLAAWFAVALLGSATTSRLFLDGSSGSPAEIVLCAALLVAFWWLGVAAHEFGHAAAARAAGFPIRQIAVGSVGFDRRNDRIRVRHVRRHRMFNGFVRIGAVHASDRRWKSSYGSMLVAGPLAQALFAFGLFVLVSPRLDDGSLLRMGLDLLIGLQWGYALLNLIPLKSGVYRSDGSKLYSIATSSAFAAASLKALQWSDYMLGDEPPSSWPAEMIAAQELALTPPEKVGPHDIEIAVSAGYLLYHHYADRHEWIEANHVLTRVIELPRPNPRKSDGLFDSVDVISAIHLALRGQNPIAARAALDRIGDRSTMQRNTLTIGARAAIALASWNVPSALELAEKARSGLNSYDLEVGINRLEASWWDEVIVAARQSLPTTESVPSPVAQPEAPPAQPRITFVEWAPAIGCYSWDPGVASDVRTAWILRRPITD